MRRRPWLRRVRAWAPLFAIILWLWGCSSGSHRNDEDAAVGDGGAATDSGLLGDGPRDGATAADGGGSPPDPWMAYRATCLAQINRYRAMVGVPPLKLWTAGDACADGQAKKGGDDFTASGTVTFHKYFLQCMEQYQNECWYSSANAVDMLTWCNDAFFAEGPPPMGKINHYSNMVNPRATAIACGLYSLPAPHGGWWMTQDFIE